MSSRLKTSLSVAVPLFLTLVLSYYLQNLIVTNQTQFGLWLSQFGRYIILVYIILQALTIIIAPIGGAFLLITMIALFGPKLAITLSYLVATPCYLVNFYLSKRFGQPLVEKIVGKGPLQKMDRFVQDTGLLMLITLRLFQSANFDYISYALGLTNVPFKSFVLVNFLAGIPASLITYLIFSKAESLTQGVVTAYLIGSLSLGLVITINYLALKTRGKNI